MSNDVQGFIVVYDRDISTERASAIKTMLQELSGVIQVTPIVADATVAIAESRVRTDLTKKLWQVLFPNASPI